MEQILLSFRYAQQKRSFAITAAFASAAAFGFAWWFSGYFTAPIRALSHNINLLNQGERDVTLPTTNTRELKSLAKDIAQLATTLKEHEQAQQQWLADIAHELRTPLTVLQGEAEALQDGIRPLDQGAISSLLEEINHLHFYSIYMYLLKTKKNLSFLEKIASTHLMPPIFFFSPFFQVVEKSKTKLQNKYIH